MNAENDDAPAASPGMSRRKMMAGVGVGAAAVWVAPAITRMSVASAATSGPPMAGSSTFDLYASFRKAVLTSPAANPTIEGFSFLQSAQASLLSTTYVLLTYFPTGTVIPLPAYQGTDTDKFPIAAINTTGTAFSPGTTYSVPPMSVVLHPGPNKDAIVGFAIPSGATVVSFSATFTDDDPVAGNGVRASVLLRLKGTSNLVLFAPLVVINGTGPGGTTTFTGPAPAGTYDAIYAVVNNNGEYGYDSTRLDFTINVTI